MRSSQSIQMGKPDYSSYDRAPGITPIMNEPPEPYNFNFCFPVPESLESSERVVLTPFIPSKHAAPFINQALLYPEIFTCLPFGPFTSSEDFITNPIEARVQKDPGYILFGIYDKIVPSPVHESSAHLGTLAGLIGLINSSSANLVTEIGCVSLLPPFQRIHVASNAVGLLLHYALGLPSITSSSPLLQKH